MTPEDRVETEVLASLDRLLRSVRFTPSQAVQRTILERLDERLNGLPRRRVRSVEFGWLIVGYLIAVTGLVLFWNQFMEVAPPAH